jgi:hypothetical protein
MVNGLLKKPRDARALYVMAHGAGAGMRHRFLERMAEVLAERKIATFRYEFPYMAKGRGRPDTPAVLQQTVRDAVETARAQAPDLPLLAGGKSLGGRMTSMAASGEPLLGVNGFVFLGFPLHAPGRVSVKRADHLRGVGLPMLFIQGTRDRLADLGQIRAVCDDLGNNATLHVIQDGDHSFNVLKRTERSNDDVLLEIAETIASWSMAHV